MYSILNIRSINRIKLLRTRGYSLPEISSMTGIPKTTVFRHIKNVDISPQFRTLWLGKRGGSKKLKIIKEKNAMAYGKKLTAKLNDKERLLFLSALYWAEGSKKDFGLVNTDPNLIRVFLSILRTVLKVEDKRIKPSIRIYEDINKDKALSYWSEVTQIPEEKFTSVNVLKGKKIGKLEYGMCRIRISKGGDLLKKIKGINASIANSTIKRYKQD